jgi:hypothetical protein
VEPLFLVFLTITRTSTLLTVLAGLAFLFKQKLAQAVYEVDALESDEVSSTIQSVYWKANEIPVWFRTKILSSPAEVAL